MLDLNLMKVVFKKEFNPTFIGLKTEAEIVEVVCDECEAINCICSILFAVKTPLGNVKLPDAVITRIIIYSEAITSQKNIFTINNTVPAKYELIKKSFRFRPGHIFYEYALKRFQKDGLPKSFIPIWVPLSNSLRPLNYIEMYVDESRKIQISDDTESIDIDEYF